MMMRSFALTTFLTTATLGTDTPSPITASPPTATPTTDDRCHFSRPDFSHLECCPTFADQMRYNATTRELSATGYVEPTLTSGVFSKYKLEGNEGAELAVATMEGGLILETTIDFGEKMTKLVNGVNELTDNPIFGEWNTTRQDWIGRNCTWEAVTNYLNGGGRGLRLRRKNLSTLTIKDLLDGTTEVTAEPADNEDEIYVVFTDNAVVEVSLPQATVTKLFMGPGGFLFFPDVENYAPGICWVTKSGTQNMDVMYNPQHGWRGDEGTRANLAADCTGFQWSYDFDTANPTQSPSAEPTSSAASPKGSTTLVAILLLGLTVGTIYF